MLFVYELKNYNISIKPSLLIIKFNVKLSCISKKTLYFYKIKKLLTKTNTMKLKLSLLGLFLLVVFSVNAQEKNAEKPTFVGKAISMQKVPSIASQTNLPPARVKEVEMQDARASKNNVVPGKDPQTEDDYFVRNPHRLAGKIAGKTPSLVFDAAESSSQPTDPSLAVGPNHVLVVFNTGFIIYDKEGNALTNQIAPNPTIFPSGGCCDLTVSYDKAADRWVLTFLGGGAQIAVSDGPDPINDGWFTYTIPSVNDYQKLSVWSDGYYITDNTSNSSNRIYALERDAMLAGDPNAQVIGFPLPGIATDGFYSPQAINVTDDNMPAPGNAPIVFLQDDAWSGVSEDHIKLWTVNVDWDTPGNSTISQPNEITTTPFISVFDGGSFSNLTQPNGGVAIDALQATVMNQAQFRKFSGHNSAVFNFVVDTDASGGELAGVRWFELRQSGDGQPWSIHQEGTYTSPDGKHAWHASMMMDIQGNIGMGYTAMAGPDTPNPTDFRVSSYYTGRFTGDPLNTMTISEELIAAGNQNIPGLRYGDYSKIDIDPDNDKEFWFINEYMNSGRKDVVGVFQIAPNFNTDVGVVSIDTPTEGTLSDNEEVTVTIFNYGENSQSNIPVELVVDGTTIANEVFAGPLASNTSEQYTFTETVDLSTEGQTYEVVSSTNLSGDEDNSNDSTTANILHVFSNDIGVTEITSPESGDGLGDEEITVVIENFGTASQSDFNVSAEVDNNPVSKITETVPGPLDAGSTLTYTFTETLNFSSTSAHPLLVQTELSGDGDSSNDGVTKIVENFPCDSNTNDTSQPIGPDSGEVTESIITIADDYIVNDANVSLNLEHTYTGDIDIKIVAPDGTEVILSDRNGGSGDDYTNTTFDDDATSPISSGTPPFTGSFSPDGNLSDFNGLTSQGDWTLVITDNAGGDGGQLLDWTLQLCSDDLLGVIGEDFVDGSELIVINEGNDQFKAQLLTTDVTNKLSITVTNMLGQTLLSHLVENTGNGYEYNLDMSYVASGVYIVRIGNNTYGSVKRIIVE